MIRPVNAMIVVVALALTGCAGAEPSGGRSTPSAAEAASTPAPSGTNGEDGGLATLVPVGGGDGGASVDACTLLTEEEVSAAYGVDVATAAPTDLGGGDTGCDYQNAEGRMLVTTSYFPAGGNAFRSVESSADAEIEGIGDGAIWIYNSVLVLKGDATFQIFAGASVPQAEDESALQAAGEELARLAVERMD